MRKIIIIYLSSLVLISCNKDFDTINDDIKSAKSVPAFTLFSNAQRELVDNMVTPDVNSNIFRLLAQQWAQTTYADESQYNLATRNIPRFFWNPLYRDVLKDLKESKRVIEADTIAAESVRINQVALTEILSVYTYSVLVNTFGDIPYSEALDINNTKPKYDDAATIYADLIVRLDAAINSLDESSESFGDADQIYGGDVGLWKKFGNALKLRIGMTLADVDMTTAKKVVEEAASGVFTSNADNALFKYLPSPPNTNKIWVNLVQSGRIDFVASNTLLDKLIALNDPRIPFYFDTTKNGEYVAGDYGKVNDNTSSTPSSKVKATDFPGDILDYVEVEFYLAEAVERGFAVGGSAEGHYNNAVTASILFWGGTNEDAASYLSNLNVKYSTAAGSYKAKIGNQKWLAMYNRGFEAWTEYRRLDYPILNDVSPDDIQGPFPLRFPYSDQEPSLNEVNYNAAVAKLNGGDNADVKLFWDKF